MTRAKSLKPVGVPKADWLPPSGYVHRVHRSKKGRHPNAVLKKNTKRMLAEKAARLEKRYEREERKRK